MAIDDDYQIPLTLRCDNCGTPLGVCILERPCCAQCVHQDEVVTVSYPGPGDIPDEWDEEPEPPEFARPMTTVYLPGDGPRDDGAEPA